MTETTSMTDVLHSLCTQLDQSNQDLVNEQQQHEFTRSRARDADQQKHREMERVENLRAELRGHKTQVETATARANEWHDAYEHLSADSKAVITALGLYIGELEGFRDTAKTKAEGIALGHVVERLKQIAAQPATDSEAA